jgi:hypothetical protein
VQHAECARDGIERGIAEGERGGVAGLEARWWMATRRLLDHCRSEVDTGRGGAALDGPGGEQAGAASDVEQPHAGPRIDGVEQRVDRLPREDTGEVVVVHRARVPAGSFEPREITRFVHTSVQRRFVRRILRLPRGSDKTRDCERPSVHSQEPRRACAVARHGGLDLLRPVSSRRAKIRR